MKISEICRCCHALGQHKSLEKPYRVDNVIEAYSLMLQDALNIEIPLKVNVGSGICDACIWRLKQAMIFKKQIIMCEEKLFLYLTSLEEAAVKEETCDLSLEEPEIKIEVCDALEEAAVKEDTSCDLSLEEPEIKTEVCDDATIKKLKPKSSGQETRKIKVKKKPKNSVKKRRKSTQEVSDLRCHICLQQLPSLTALRTHVDTHKTYTCSDCQSTYSNRTTIIRHVQQHLGLIEFRCKICSKLYQHRSSLREHVLRHNGTYLKIVCEHCGKKFGNNTELHRHIDSIHLKLKNISCTACDAKFSIIKHLKSHMKKKHSSLIKNEESNPRRTKVVESCNLCSKTFSSPSSLVDHMLAVHKDEKTESEVLRLYPGVAKTYYCQFCDAKYYNSLNLNRHMVKHRDMVTHRDRKLRLYCCEFCSEYFSTKYILERHKRKHTGVKTEKCEMCDKSYYHKNSLKQHVEKFHSVQKVIKEKVKCSECARSVYNLEEHMSCHRRKPFKCDICQKCYPRINSLNRHKEKHSGVRYECGVCPKSYIMKSKMLLHRKRVHFSMEGAGKQE